MKSRIRQWLWAVSGVASLGVATVGARWWAGEEVLRALEGRGVTWSHQRDTFGAVHLAGLSWKGAEAERVDIALVPAPHVLVQGVQIDLRSLGGGAGEAPGASASSGSELAAVVAVDVEDLHIRLGDDPIAEAWSGTLAPTVAVEGPGGHLSRGLDGSWTVHLERDLEVGPASGQVAIDATCGDTCTVSVDVPALVLAHPFLASEPLPPSPAHAKLDWDLRGDGHLKGDVRIGELRLSVQGTVITEPDVVLELDFDLHDTPLEDVVALFGDTIPEASRARMYGTLGASGSWSWPEGAWSLVPRFEQLAVEGVIPDVNSLKHGPISWVAPDEEGTPRLRQTGEGISSFVPFPAAGLFPSAVLAAEDSGFSGHQGIDPVAIQAALEEARTEGIDGMRGGSTVTQQLAKNLFLDTRERTINRKLRELLYALELDRVLPKQRILELYINVVELGEDLYGVGPAASAYFLKQPARLSVTEVAFLAALLPAPRTLSRRAWRGGRPPKSRMNVIIGNMSDMKRIDPATAAQARRTSLRLVPPP